MLNKLLSSKQEEARGPKQRRPYLATQCNDLNQADKWRQQILREIGKKVMEIQNAGLGEHRYVLLVGVTTAYALYVYMITHTHNIYTPLAPPAHDAPNPTICRIRDLNDEINRLIREKGHWEKRIVQLGGPDYGKSGAPIADSEGYEQSQTTGRGMGYRYVSPLSCMGVTSMMYGSVPQSTMLYFTTTTPQPHHQPQPQPHHPYVGILEQQRRCQA